MSNRDTVTGIGRVLLIGVSLFLTACEDGTIDTSSAAAYDKSYSEILRDIGLERQTDLADAIAMLTVAELGYRSARDMIPRQQLGVLESLEADGRAVENMAGTAAFEHVQERAKSPDAYTQMAGYLFLARQLHGKTGEEIIAMGRSAREKLAPALITFKRKLKAEIATEDKAYLAELKTNQAASEAKLREAEARLANYKKQLERVSFSCCIWVDAGPSVKLDIRSGLPIPVKSFTMRVTPAAAGLYSSIILTHNLQPSLEPGVGRTLHLEAFELASLGKQGFLSSHIVLDALTFTDGTRLPDVKTSITGLTDAVEKLRKEVAGQTASIAELEKSIASQE